MSQRLGKVLRILALILVGGTAAFTLLGGIGTTCVAFNAEQYGKAFAAFIPYKSIYQAFVVTSILAGLIGIAATVAMLRGYRWAYWAAIAAAVTGLATAGVHMYYSSTLKEISFFAAAPENMRFYVAAITLIVLLTVRLPGAWQYVDFTLPWRGGSGKASAAGMAAIAVGLITLTTPMWAAPNHVVDGFNLVYVLEYPLAIAGLGLTLGGLLLIALAGAGWSPRATLAGLRRRPSTRPDQSQAR
jgi:hypothetical protein